MFININIRPLEINPCRRSQAGEALRVADGLELQRGQQCVVPPAGKVVKIGAAQLLNHALCDRLIEFFSESHAA